MRYLYESDLNYKDRKKKLNFKENFYITVPEIMTATEAEINFFLHSKFGKFIESRYSFFAKGIVAIYQAFGEFECLVLELPIDMDCSEIYKKI